MNVQRGKLVSGGRLQVPAAFRKALGLGDGATVLMELVDGELHVRPYRDTVSLVQEKLRRFAPKTGSVADELIAERRNVAERE